MPNITLPSETESADETAGFDPLAFETGTADETAGVARWSRTTAVRLPHCWHEAELLRQGGRDHPVPAGMFLDWQDDTVRQFVYELRAQTPQPTYREIAALGFQHWLRVARANDAYARRQRHDGARRGAPYRPGADHRRWTRSQNMRNNPAAPARPNSRPDGSLTARRFGIEIEFNRRRHSPGSIRSNIAEALQRQNIETHVEGYHHTTRNYWKMTTDATVTGGELVSPILAGDTASLDEVRDVIRTVKAEGGETGRGVGMHVHHDATDFNTPELREHLVDVLETCEPALAAYIPESRRSGATSCGAGLMTPAEWRRVRQSVTSITPGAHPTAGHDSGNSVSRYRFFNIEAPLRKYGTIEARGLGHTLHAGKVRVWVRMGQAIMEAALRGLHPSETVSRTLTVAAPLTPQELAEFLLSHRLIGQRTADRFIAECDRRS